MKPAVFLVSVIGLLAAWMLVPSPALSHETANTTVTFDREIARILKRKCLACHSPNNLAFPLTSYEEARSWARAIEEEALRRHMPPWRAVAGYGQFVNDGGLTGRELQLLVAWVQGNGPKDLQQKIIANVNLFRTPPAARLRIDLDRWELGRPDFLRALPPSLVAAGQPDHVRKVEVDLALTSDRMIRAVEFKPADRRVLRAAFFSVRETGQWIGSWTPWYGISSLPRGVAHRLPAGAHIVAELHYRGTGVPVEGRGSLGIHFARDRAPQCTSDLALASGPGRPEETLRGARAQARAVLRAETRILALKPELTASADSVEVTARRPDGTATVLLFANGILPAWPTPYILKDALSLPAGTEISMSSYGQWPVLPEAASAVRLMVSGGGYGDCGGPRSLTSKVNGNVWTVSR